MGDAGWATSGGRRAEGDERYLELSARKGDRSWQEVQHTFDDGDLVPLR
jgi:hypothetical protein